MNYRDRNYYVSHALALQVLIMWGKVILMQGMPVFYQNQSLLNYVSFGVVAFIYLPVVLQFPSFFGKMQIAFIIDAFLIIVCIFSIWIYPENSSEICSNLLWTIGYCFLPFHFILTLDSLEILCKYMTRYSYYLILISLLSSFFILTIGHTTVSTWTTYSMPLSYGTMYAVMWLLWDFFNNHNNKSLVFAGIGTVIICIVGSRNPLLAITTYVIIMLIKSCRSKKNAVFFAAMLPICFLIVLNFQFVLNQVIVRLDSIGISSRTLSLLSQGNAVTYDSRNSIHSTLFDALNKHPVFGLGIGGDVVSTGEMAHSLYLSILSNFGYFLGGIIIIVFLYICVKAISTQNQLNKSVAILYICIVLPRSFTGGDIWGNDAFWWLIAICFICIKTRFSNYSLQESKE
mgnify:CR=1 FL=1